MKQIQSIDTAFDRLNTILDASGALGAEAIQRAVYELRLAIVRALGDADRTAAAEASLAELGDAIEVRPSEGDDDEVLPGACIMEIGHINLAELLSERDEARQERAWTWVERNASFWHVGNDSHEGVREFVLNLGLTFQGVPDEIKPLLAVGAARHLGYLVFHSGA